MYRGRFAPSPSGPLHFGSLLAALASYLDAKANQGLWLVRIEDIDPPREMPGASTIILTSLEQYGLHWDEPVLYQSNRVTAYQDKLNYLLASDHAYACRCTRKQIKQMGGLYNGHCRNKALATHGNAIRLNNQIGCNSFDDLILGKQEDLSLRSQEDFIIHRRDGLYAYQLAVVLDDIEQAISHVIRGQDLLDTSYWQLSLFGQFNATAPHYGHIPLALAEDGRKLSKQNHAPAIVTDDEQAIKQTLLKALNFLNQAPCPELKHANKDEILDWAVQHWQPSKLAQTNNPQSA